MEACEKGKIYRREEVRLPNLLRFGITSNPDGKNNFVDPTN
jgi:hypothetical protein